MTQQPPNIQVKDIDHLGIVAGIIDQMGWVDEINELVGTHSLEQVSTGQVLKAMILNGLGFVAAPLYLFAQFFEGKATEHLIGEGVKPLNGTAADSKVIALPSVEAAMVESNSAGSSWRANSVNTLTSSNCISASTKNISNNQLNGGNSQLKSSLVNLMLVRRQ